MRVARGTALLLEMVNDSLSLALIAGNICTITGVPMGWMSFSGKVTYLEPGWTDPIGNYDFVVYVEDRNDPGSGTDRFWIEIKDDQVVAAISMPRPATDNTIEFEQGNIVVPHGAGN